MGFTQSITSIGLGGIVAWIIVYFFKIKNTISYFTLSPWPLEQDDGNLALVGVGLASVKPSVMDATPSAQSQVMIMAPTPQAPMQQMVEAQSPEVVHIAVPVYPEPVAVAPSPMAMSTSPASMGSPVTITPQPVPSPSA